ncbi:response regulator [Shimia abyssi]|uniref:histidine kinase n=1 Tax=Shimia abyssi TaxID=1662395 RepID=A0A2P8FBL9_9RHOB|nr:response regulator receiver domain-containing protein [Shimia abyssi]
MHSRSHDIIAAFSSAKGVELIVDYDLFLPTKLVGDPGRIRQVLTNLIGNALKFTSEGHVQVRVVGVIQNDGTEAEMHITVQDTGIGIPEDMIGHIFGEFNQVDEARNKEFEGTGLGLAITRKLIDLMSGDIWVESKESEGSCFGFSLTLPIEENCDGLPTPLPSCIGNVLIADEAELNGHLLKRQIEQMGAKATLCAGEDCIQDLAGQMDLVLIDQYLPKLDVLELVEKLRSDGCVTPIILLGSDTTSIASDPRTELVQGVLNKPISRGDLFATIKRAVSHEEGSAESPAQETPTRSMRILAAEDNKTNRLVLSKLLKSLDIELEFATNGLEAVDLFQSFKPDLIFMDISMPKMDGKEATAKIRGLEAGRMHTPIVALTAHAVNGDKEGILAAGLDHYLTKPLRKAAIFEKIQDHCPTSARPPIPEAEPQEPLQASG